jgi:hypothetical protein
MIPMCYQGTSADIKHVSIALCCEFVGSLTVIGHRIKCGTRAARVALLGSPKFGPVPSIAWMALWRDMPNATLPPHEIEKCKEHIPRHDPEIEEKVGNAGE